MRIEIYIPGLYITMIQNGAIVATGTWWDLQLLTKEKNVFHLIDAAIKLPVTRVTLEI